MCRSMCLVALLCSFAAVSWHSDVNSECTPEPQQLLPGQKTIVKKLGASKVTRENGMQPSYKNYNCQVFIGS